MTEGSEKSQRGRGTVISDALILSFAKAYNAWKNNGYYPVEIREKLLPKFEVKQTTYYRYLRIAREKGLINDSYEENMEKSVEARRLWLIANGGMIKGVKFFFPKRIPRSRTKSNADTTKEHTSTIKNICKTAKRLIFNK